MLKRELIELLSNIEDEANIEDILKESDAVKGLIANGQTLDAFKSRLEDEDFVKFLSSEKDKHANKYLETWKANNLEKELQPFIEKNYPDLVVDPAKKEVLELKQQLERLEKERNRETLLNAAKDYAIDKKIPTGFVDKLLAENEEETLKNIDAFEKEWSSSLETKVKEEVKGACYYPPGGGSNVELSVGERLAKEKNSVVNKVPNDPWQK
ncbi:DUF4355 domain-containing protein [Metaclostridioides mangenotii]|uniref:DUF4355 domain-containing protein n=1 Tax=Metaclostridioides mangenotii TaxID=1540 RepID=UPI000488FC09|nr:DUF4355 domain-containing protein [Clostridioides mangenotii]